MSAVFKPTLEVTLNELPFLFGFAFQGDDEKFANQHFRRVIAEFATKYYQKMKAGGKSEMALDQAVDLLACACRGGAVSGLDVVWLDIDLRISRGEKVAIAVPVQNVRFEIKRYGLCLGLGAIDAHDKKHNDATATLEELTQSNVGLEKFIRAYSVIAPRPHAHDGGSVDLTQEIASLSRYMPDVEWVSMMEDFTRGLRHNYINAGRRNPSYGVQVGLYHDMQIWAKVVFGPEDSDRNWRSGACTQRGFRLSFESEYRVDYPCMQYSVCMATGEVGKPRVDVLYEEEQRLMKELSNIMFNALMARHVAESNNGDPGRTKWLRALNP